MFTASLRVTTSEHLLSLQLDRLGARAQQNVSGPFSAAIACSDLCCVREISLFLAVPEAPIGADFAHTMLVARKRVPRSPRAQRTHCGSRSVSRSDAMRLPFADASFDLVTTLCFRNLSNTKPPVRNSARTERAAPSPSSNSRNARRIVGISIAGISAKSAENRGSFPVNPLPILFAQIRCPFLPSTELASS